MSLLIVIMINPFLCASYDVLPAVCPFATAHCFKVKLPGKARSLRNDYTGDRISLNVRFVQIDVSFGQKNTARSHVSAQTHERTVLFRKGSRSESLQSNSPTYLLLKQLFTPTSSALYISPTSNNKIYISNTACQIDNLNYLKDFFRQAANALSTTPTTIFKQSEAVFFRHLLLMNIIK